MWINVNYESRLLLVPLLLSVLFVIIALNFNTAFSQNEDLSYLDVNSSSSAQVTKFSVAAWFKTSTDYDSDAFIVNKAGASSNMNYGIWMTSTEKVRGGFETPSGSSFYATSPLSYNDGNWHYVVVTFDGSTIGLYMDGVSVASKSAKASPDNGGDEPIRLGADSQSLNNYFVGDVDEIRIWKSALTPQQIIDAYNGKFESKDLIEYLDFSEPIVQVNTTTIDAAVTNQTGIPDINGTLSNESNTITPILDNGTKNNDTVVIPTFEIPKDNNDGSTNDTDFQQNQQNEENNTAENIDNTALKETLSVETLIQLNQPPKADAGDDQKAKVNTEVKLDADGSTDQDGEIVSYEWEQTKGPDVDLKNSDKQVALFDVPEAAADSNLVFELTVTDDKDDTDKDDVTVKVEQIPQDNS